MMEYDGIRLVSKGTEIVVIFSEDIEQLPNPWMRQPLSTPKKCHKSCPAKTHPLKEKVSQALGFNTHYYFTLTFPKKVVNRCTAAVTSDARSFIASIVESPSCVHAHMWLSTTRWPPKKHILPMMLADSEFHCDIRYIVYVSQPPWLLQPPAPRRHAARKASLCEASSPGAPP